MKVPKLQKTLLRKMQCLELHHPLCQKRHVIYSNAALKRLSIHRWYQGMMKCLQKTLMTNLTKEHDIVYVSFCCDWLTFPYDGYFVAHPAYRIHDPNEKNYLVRYSVNFNSEMKWAEERFSVCTASAYWLNRLSSVMDLSDLWWESKCKGSFDNTVWWEIM